MDDETTLRATDESRSLDVGEIGRIDGLAAPSASRIDVSPGVRRMTEHPILSPELDIVRNSSIVGGVCAGVAFWSASAWVNYSTTLRAAGVTLDGITRGEFQAYVTMSKYGTWIFGITAVLLQIRVTLKVRAMKTTEEPNPVLRESLWQKTWMKLRLRAHSIVDRW